MAAHSGFDAIVAAHHAEIYRYVLRMTGQAPVAAALSRETFLHAYRAYRSLPAGAGERGRLFAIATSLLGRKDLRGQQRRRLADGVLASLGGAPAAIEAAVGILPFRQRAAFLQRKVHLLEYAAIGQSLRCSIERAQALVLHALRRIRQALEGRERSASRRTVPSRRRERRTWLRRCSSGRSGHPFSRRPWRGVSETDGPLPRSPEHARLQQGEAS
jgi:RNA polymerase sigma-70 factor (ECF subfamily)